LMNTTTSSEEQEKLSPSKVDTVESSHCFTEKSTADLDTPSY